MNKRDQIPCFRPMPFRQRRSMPQRGKLAQANKEAAGLSEPPNRQELYGALQHDLSIILWQLLVGCERCARLCHEEIHNVHFYIPCPNFITPMHHYWLLTALDRFQADHDGNMLRAGLAECNTVRSCGDEARILQVVLQISSHLHQVEMCIMLMREDEPGLEAPRAFCKFAA